MPGSSPEDIKRYGYTPVCTCGSRFMADKWRLKESIGPFDISTVDLEIPHGWGSHPVFWYETMVFRADGNDSQWREAYIEFENTQVRYVCRGDAIAGHEKICREIQALVNNTTERGLPVKT